MSKHTVQRWDLDKTYLVTDTESLRSLLRIPFERAQDKRAFPGVAALVKQLRRSSAERGATTSVNFVTASPPQIGRAIRQKLHLDGIEIDEIRFKNQIHHLVRGQLDALREHIGFKLSELLQSARAGRRDGEELLFGDDWESDPLIYSMYADVIEGRLSWTRLEGLLDKAGVSGTAYLHTIRECVERDGPRRRVRAICVLRARPRTSADFEPFGPRMFWFDSYLECALILHALGDLDARGVVEVTAASDVEPEIVGVAFEALLDAGLMPRVEAGSLWRRAHTRWRVSRGHAPLAPPAERPPIPDYDSLVQVWAYRPRKEVAVVHEQE
ncbi:MAG: phosphatase domain-containing protein [Candidatus Binatia bacterium]